MSDFRTLLSRALLRAQEALEPSPSMTADEVRRRIAIPVEPVMGDRVPVMSSAPAIGSPMLANEAEEEVAV